MTTNPTPHFFRCRVCNRKVERPGHLLLRDTVCYGCRNQQHRDTTPEKADV